MTEEERIIKAGHARELLEHPVLQEIHEWIATTAFEELKKVSDKDLDAMRIYKQFLNINDAYWKFLNKSMTDGKMAEATLQKRNFKRNVRI